jgi:molecular chaperone GrpE
VTAPDEARPVEGRADDAESPLGEGADQGVGSDHETAPVEPSDLDPAAVDALSHEEEPGSLLHDGLDEVDEQVADGFADPAGVDLVAERDEYLEALRRVKAEFDNYKKRTEKERLSMVDRAAEGLVRDLLPVLDACEAAVAQGDSGVAQIRTLIDEVLSRGGLEAMQPEGKPFDPTLHEAVMREEGDGAADTVLEVMRAGYTWRGRVLRPAMVKVQT